MPTAGFSGTMASPWPLGPTRSSGTFQGTGFLTLALGLILGAAVLRGGTAAPEFPTAEDRDWLGSHGPLRYAPNPDRPPIEFFTSAGQLEGLAADTVSLLALKMGVKVIAVRYPTAAHAREGVRRGEVDFCTSVGDPVPEGESMVWTTPYLTVPETLLADVASAAREPGSGVTTPLRFGVAAGNPRLLDLLQRAVDRLSEGETAALLRRGERPAAGYGSEPGGTSVGLLLVLGLVGLVVGVVTTHAGWVAKTRRASPAAGQDRHFRAIFYGSSDPMFLHDADTGAILEVNDAATEGFAYSREDLLRLTIGQLSAEEPPFTQADAVQWVRRAAAGERQVFEWKARRRTGESFWVEVALRGLSLGTRRQVVAIVRDISRRKAVEEALRVSELHQRSIVGNAPFGVHFYELTADDTLIFRAANPSADTILGISHAALLGRSIEEAFPGLVRSDIPQIYRRLAREGGVYQQDQIVYHEGAISGAYEIRAFQTSPEHMAVFFTDIKERKRTELALRRTEAMQSTILNSVPQSIFWKDRDSVYLGCNEVFARATGLRSPAEVVGKTDFDLPWPAAEAEAYRADDREVMEQGRPKMHIIEPLQQADGSRLWIDTTKVPLVDAGGEVFGVLGVYEDVTERKRTEEAERHSRQMLADVLDTIPARVFWKGRNLQYLGCNRLFALDAGLTDPDQLLGRNDFDMPWREQAELYRADDRRVIETETPKIGYEEPQDTPEGRRIWLRTSKIPLRDTAGEVVGILGTYEDITERKLAEMEVLRLNADLERRVEQRTAELQDANRELEAFSYSVSHDLRAPLRAIDGYSAMLEEDHADRLDPEAQRLLAVVRREAQRMGRLIEDLLTFSRLGRSAMNPVPLDMTSLFREVYQDLAAQTPGRELQFQLESLPPATADQALMRQVVINLLSNALKYTRTRPVAEIRVTGSAADQEVVYRIADNGVGFDMRYADRLFGVFHRLHSDTQFEGTGVGLALAHRIVERHGGRLWAEAEPDRGATFFVALPLPATLP